MESLRPLAVTAIAIGLGLGARLARPALAPAAPPRRPEALLAYDVRDTRTGEPIPCKLTFVGVRGTPRPAFTHGDIGRVEEDGVIAAYDRVMSLPGVGSVRVPLGSYDVWVSHGPEWDVAVQRGLEVTAQGAELRARLAHVIDTSGWLSGDFHVHAAASPDSVVPMEHRVIEFASDGVDLIVSTDHNTVSDYAPAIRGLGAGKLIASLAGDEITTASWGHFGAFPLAQELAHAGHGAVPVHGRSPREMFADVHAMSRDAIVDVHHPRLDAEIGYFTIGGLEPHADRASRRGFSFDFDAVEVLNGYQDPLRRSVDRTIDDWMGLLNHGHIVTATGNSDTHHLTFNIGGYPRNYVRVRDDRPERLSPGEIAAALKGHHAFFTTGPFVRVSAAGGGIGDVVPAPGGHTTVDVQVDAPSWMSVDRVILYVDGKEARRWRVPGTSGVTRFHEAVPVTVGHDSYVVVRVDGDRLMAPVVGDDRTFGVRPLALTNPLFVDVDGDGKYDPAYPHGSHAR